MNKGSHSPSNNVLPGIEVGARSGGVISWTDMARNAVLQSCCRSALVQGVLVCMGGAVRIDKTIDAIELYYVPGWTDGLPVVPPNPLAALAPAAVI